MYTILYVPFSVFYEIFIDFPLGNEHFGEFVVHVFSVGNKSERLCS